jgi:hypothetical protein
MYLYLTFLMYKLPKHYILTLKIRLFLLQTGHPEYSGLIAFLQQGFNCPRSQCPLWERDITCPDRDWARGKNKGVSPYVPTFIMIIMKQPILTEN